MKLFKDEQFICDIENFSIKNSDGKTIRINEIGSKKSILVQGPEVQRIIQFETNMVDEFDKKPIYKIVDEKSGEKMLIIIVKTIPHPFGKSQTVIAQEEFEKKQKNE